MLKWFMKKPLVHEVRDAPLDEPMVHYVHERKRLPDEGAQSYAFETLQLAVHSPIDGAVRVRKNLGVPFPQMEGQLWYRQSGPVSGIPSMAGGIYGSRQFSPDGTMADLGSASGINTFALQTNNPHDNGTDTSSAAMLNNPFPQGGGGRGSAVL